MTFLVLCPSSRVNDIVDALRLARGPQQQSYITHHPSARSSSRPQPLIPRPVDSSKTPDTDFCKPRSATLKVRGH